jgi:hypothetical protein
MTITGATTTETASAGSTKIRLSIAALCLGLGVILGWVANSAISDEGDGHSVTGKVTAINVDGSQIALDKTHSYRLVSSDPESIHVGDTVTGEVVGSDDVQVLVVDSP